MLKSSAIVIGCKNHKSEKFDVICNFTRLVVRDFEYSRITGKKDYIRLKALVEDDHEGINALECPEETIREYIPNAVEAQLFLDMRKEVNDLKEEISSFGVTLDQYNALSDIDKIFITLQAHTAMPAIKLDTSILENIDLKPIIGDYFKKGSLKGIKNKLQGIFTKCVGSEGELFYGVKLRKSDFNDEDVRTCLSYFRGTAKRSVDKKDGNEIYGSYDWVCKDGNTNAQAMAITNLFSVVLDREKDYEVIKPEESTEK